MKIGNVDRFEFAEVFAALCLKFERDLDVEPARFNRNGGTIAMGHAFGATGSILVATLLDEMERSDSSTGRRSVEPPAWGWQRSSKGSDARESATKPPHLTVLHPNSDLRGL